MNRRPLKKIASEIATILKRETKDVIKLGGLLAEAKEQLDEHGQWIPWLSENFALSPRTAQRYQAAHAFAAKYDTVSHLPLTVRGLYALIEADRAGHFEAVGAALAEAKVKRIADDRVWGIVASLRPPPELRSSDEGSDEDPSLDAAEDEAQPSGEASDEDPLPEAAEDEEPEPEEDRPPPSAPSLSPRQAAQLSKFEAADSDQGGAIQMEEAKS